MSKTIDSIACALQGKDTISEYNRAELYIRSIKELISRPLFPGSDLNYIRECIVRYEEVLKTQTLHLQRHNDWEDVNVRYGADSIRGTFVELLAIAIWNSKNQDTYLYFVPSTKREQIVGIDVKVNNFKWSRPFNTQIKSAIIENSNLVVKDKYRQYSVRDVDRIIFVDEDNLTIYHFNYKSFIEVSKGQQYIQLTQCYTLPYFHKFTGV